MKKSRMTPQECKALYEKFYADERAQWAKEFEQRKQEVLKNGEEWDHPRSTGLAGVKVSFNKFVIRVRSFFQRWF